MEMMVCPMGSSRLFGTLAQQDYYSEHQDSDQDPEGLEQANPDQLFRDCVEALQNRPAWPHSSRGGGEDGFAHCPLEALIWAERKYLEQILSYRPDILCLQEVDHYYDTFQPILASPGYQSSFLPKPWSPCLDVASNNGPDGCALFYRRSCFSLLHTSHLHLSSMMLPTNQMDVVQTLCCRVTGQRLCMAVSHLKARSGWERLRVARGWLTCCRA